MTWLALVRKNLLRRPTRTLLTAAGVSLGVGLIVALLSITAGVHETASELIHVGRADFGLFQGDVSDMTRSYLPESLDFRYLRTVCMVCAAYAANVLENALSTLGHEARERAFAQTDELLADYSQWPFGRKATGNGIGANLPQIIAEVR